MEEVHVYEGGGGIASVGGVVLMCDWLLLRSEISIGEFPNTHKYLAVNHTANIYNF